MRGGSEDADRRWDDSMPDVYETFLVPAVFEPFASDLARRVAATRPRRVLEIAAGTGILTRALLGLPGVEEVVATDLNASMVDAGRRKAAGARWEVADAMDLPFEAGEFDAVVCQFGVMFFPDKAAGLREARRVLARGGSFHASTWGPLEEHELETVFTAALRAVLPDDPPSFLETTPHGYADPDRFAADARSGGFAEVEVEKVSRRGRPISARDLAVGYCTGTPVRAGLEARGDLATLTDAVAADAERLLGSDPVTGSMTAYVLRAT